MEFDGSVRIARPAEDVFALLTDVQDWATGPGSPIVAMDKIPGGPTRVGTRWREVVALGPLWTMTMWSEATAVEPPTVLAERFWGGRMRGTLRYTVTPIDDAHSVLRQQQTMRTVGWLTPFVRLLGWMLERRLDRRLLDIRDQLESPGD